MEMNFNQFVVSHDQEAIPVKIFVKIIPNGHVVQIVPFDKQLSVEFIFQHKDPPKENSFSLQQ